MSSFDFGKLLSTLGGAVSAQGSGGSQAVQQFLAGLNKQEEARLSRNHDAQQQSRQRMFQLTRDRAAEDERRVAREDDQAFRKKQSNIDRKLKVDQQTAANKFATAEREQTQIFSKAMAEMGHANDEVQTLLKQKHALERLDKTAENNLKLTQVNAELTKAQKELDQKAQAVENQKSRDATAANLGTQIDANREAREQSQEYAVINQTNAQKHAEVLLEKKFDHAINLHELDNEKLDREKAEKRRQSAAISYGALMAGTEAQRQEAAAQILRLEGSDGKVPDGKGGLITIPVNWDDREATIDRINAANENGGFTSANAISQAERKTEQGNQLSVMTGGTKEYTTDADYYKTAQQHAHARSQLDAGLKDVEALQLQIEALSKSSLNEEDAETEEVRIGKAINDLAQRHAALGSKHRQFFGKGADLAASFRELRNSTSSLGSQLVQVGKTNYEKLAGAWTYADSSANPMFSPRYADSFEENLTSPGMIKKSAALTETMGEIVSLGEGLTGPGYGNLNADQLATRKKLKDYANDNNSLDAQDINRQIFALKKQGKNDEAEDLMGMLDKAHKMGSSLEVIRLGVTKGQTRQVTLSAIGNLGHEMQQATGVGFFVNDGEALNALNNHGPKDETTGEPREPRTEKEMQAFKASYFQSPEGVEKFSSALLGSMTGVTSPDQAYAQGQQMVASMIKRLGISGAKGVKEARAKILDVHRKNTNSAGSEIYSDTEAVAEIHSYDYGLVNRAGAATSSRDLLPADQQEPQRDAYIRNVFDRTVEDSYAGRSRADVVRSFIKQSSAARTTEYRQRPTTFGDITPVGGGLGHALGLQTPEHGSAEAQAMQLEAEVATELGSNASFRDIHDLHMDVDKTYQKAMGRSGLLIAQGVKGQDREYTTGDKSLRKQYIESTNKPNEHIVQRLDKLDYWRARSMNDLRESNKLSDGEMVIMRQEQTLYRNMTLQSALDTFGLEGNGVSLESIGMTLAEEDDSQLPQDADFIRDPYNAIDTNADRITIATAYDELENLPTGSVHYYDLDVGPGTRVAELTPILIEEEKKRLEKAKEFADAIDAARDSELRKGARNSLAMLPEDAFESAAALGNALENNLPMITGNSEELLKMVTSSASKTIETIKEASTLGEAFDTMITFLAQNASTSAQAKTGVTVVGQSKQSYRNALIQAFRLDFGNIRLQVNDLGKEIRHSIQVNEPRTHDKLPTRLRGAIDQKQYDKLFKIAAANPRDPNATLPLALRIFIANEKVNGNR